MTRLEKPVFMTAEEMNNQYNGRILLVKQPDRNKIFEEGEVVAWGEDTDKDYDALLDMLGMEEHGWGFIHFAYIDQGEDIHFVFGEIKHGDSLPIYL